METLPSDIQAIIIDYKSQLEHVDRFKTTLHHIYPMYRCRCRLRMNRQFHGIFFPAWWELLGFFDAFPVFMDQGEEEPPTEPHILHLT